MNPRTRRAAILGAVLGVTSASASFAQGKETAPGLAKKTVFPTSTGAGGVTIGGTATRSPTPLVDPTFTATPFPSATHTRTLVDASPTVSRTPTASPAPTKTATPRPTATATATGAFDYAALPGERTQLLELINRSRAEAGVPPLSWHQGAADVAQDKSRDQCARHYSAHEMPAGYCYQNASPCWDTPVYVWDVLTALGHHWRAVAENVWHAPALGGQQAETANRVFYDSPSHRNAMLSPDFTHCGIGMFYCERVVGVFVTEIFLVPDASAAQAFDVETTRSADGRLSQARVKRR